MGLFSRMLRGQSGRSRDARSAPITNAQRKCHVETLEQRRVMAGDIHVGMVYFEPNDGTDITGNTLQITWNGGEPNTQLQQVVIDTDKLGDGLTIGDTFFDTAAGGQGAFGSYPFTVVDSTGIDSVNATVTDGGTKLILDFTGFDVGEKLTFRIDVDEMGFRSANAVAEGNEFEGSKLNATFTAPHFHTAAGGDIFLDDFDSKFAGLGLNLPNDNYVPPGTTSSPIFTAGAAFTLKQVPLPIRITGTVYEDINSNNHQDAGDNGIGGVTLELWKNDGSGYVTTGVTTTTDADGRYAFENVLPGQYSVREAQPSNYFSVGATAGKVNGVTRGVVANSDSITDGSLLGGEEWTSNDFAEVRPASLSGHVYHDANNDGDRDSGEEGIGGVTITVQRLTDSGPLPAPVTVTTAADGTWVATGLAPGAYRVIETHPTGWLDGKDRGGSAGGTAQNPGDLIETALLVSGQSGVDYDFGELLASSISGQVHADRDGDCDPDPGEPLLAGVTIRLYDANNNQVATTQTDQQGRYTFSNLAPGVYKVVEEQPSGYFGTVSHPGSVNGTAGLNEISGITLTSGTTGTDYDFCEFEPVGISGHVYVDINNNGVFDSGEAPIAGVTMRLLAADGTPTGVTTVTAADGTYSFEGLAPGTYGVAEDQPSGYFDGIDAAGSEGGLASNPGDSITGVFLTPSVYATDYDFGELPPASIQGRVHADIDGDCEPDENEPLLAGVTIYLLNADGERIGSTTTDINGEYKFTNLAPGVYGVEEIQPSAYFQGDAMAGDAGGSVVGTDMIVGVMLDPGQDAVDYNFCEALPASISGQVHADRDGDCDPDPGEILVQGATVYLLDVEGNRIGETTTDSNGRYKFDGLEPGDYGVELAVPGGYFKRAAHAGSSGGQATDQDKVIGAELGSGEQGTDYDFCVVEPVKISGSVYVDLNQNCEFDGSETGIAGVVIRLLDSAGNFTGVTTLTNEDGSYEFSGLPPGTYGVAEIQPNGYFNGCAEPGTLGGDDDDAADKITGVVIPPAVHAQHYNFGELPPGKITGYVFQDGPAIVVPNGTVVDIPAMRDGQRDADDTAIAGVKLQLGTLSGEPVLDGAGQPIFAITDANGYYEFGGLAPGMYTVFQVQPSNFLNGLNTPGTTGGTVYQAGRDILPATLTLAQTGDAITRIFVGPGGLSNENNFAEVLVMPPTPPAVQQTITAGFIPIISPPPAPQPGVPLFFAPAPGLSILPNAPPIVNNTTYFGGVGFLESYTWHLSVVNGGTPRGSAGPTGAIARRVSARDDAWTHTNMTDAEWTLYQAGNVQLKQLQFGRRHAKPIVGDFNGDGISEVGVYVDGEWFIDVNGNGAWDEGDMWAELGGIEDLPVVGDWDGDGKTDIGIFGPSWPGDERAIAAEPGLPDPENRARNVLKNVPPQPFQATSGARDLRLTASGQLRSDVIDHVFRHGVAGDVPLAGDWNGDGVHSIALFSGGMWHLDVDGDGKLTAKDQKFAYGNANDVPVVGDFNGDGQSDIGVYRRGVWYIDTDNNHRLEAHDRAFAVGGADDMPVVGDWDGDGRDEPGTFQPSPTVAPGSGASDISAVTP